ncbi:MAG: response regulator [Anaerolineae bacterium]|nr:response regulator [Anaerolineae bacterium]
MSADTNSWLSSPLMGEYEFQSSNDVKHAVKTLQNIRYDLLILDDTLLGSSAMHIVHEFKRRFPSIPIILLSDRNDLVYRTTMMRAGADAFLMRRTSGGELHYHVKQILNQHRQNRSLVQLNHKLHALASLPRLLYSAPDPYTLILQATKLIRNTFRLYGVALILQDGDLFRLYAGSEEVTHKNKLYESIVRPNEFDPFIWTMHNRVAQIYEDINKNPNYTPIPILTEVQAAVILPLIHQNRTLGTMAIFAQAGDTFTQEDLIIYEQFAVQLIAALHNAYQQQEQSISIRSNQHLLRAWEKFATLSSPDEIGYALCELVQDISYVGKALVWLAADGTDSGQETFVDTQNNRVVLSLAQTDQQQLVKRLIDLFSDDFHPVLLNGRTTRDQTLSLLFEALHSRQIIAAPVSDSTRFLGCLVAGITDERNFRVDTINLIEHLCNTAGMVLERILLTQAVEEKNNRLEAILFSITEGIFFVDENNRVAFCNPQVTELTSVSASQIVNQDADSLLKGLAAVTADPTRTYAQLLASRQAVAAPDNRNEDYPIVELSIGGSERELTVEFVKIAGLGKISWVGVIRSAAKMRQPSQFQDLLVNSMSENLRMPYAQVRSLITTLSEQHGHFSYREREHLLSLIRASVDRVGQLWNNFLEIYNLEVKGIVLNRENTAIQDLVQRVVNNPYANKANRRMACTAQPRLPLVKVDEFRMERAIANIAQRALDVSPEGATVEVLVEQHDQEVWVVVKDTGEPIRAERLERLFDPFSQFSNTGGMDFGLYIARELVTRHGGRIWAENNDERGVMIIVALPVSSEATRLLDGKTASPSLPDVVPDDAPEQSVRAPSRAPNRAPNVIMFVAGRSELSQAMQPKLEDAYEVLAYQSGDEAVEDVNATHLDLIVIDTVLDEGSGLDICKRMRKRTEVPIILIADKVSDADKVRGLNMGADDYITRPISDEEWLARIQVIFKRRHIPDRTSEPLSVGGLYIDFARREVFIANKPVELTRIEYDLLHTLVVNKGHVLTHRQLLEKVWGPEYENETHYLWVNISRLRKKLESRQGGTRYIHTQAGTGYFFDVL